MGRMGGFRYELDGDRYVRAMDTMRGRNADRALPFYSRYHTADTTGVDVLGQDVSHMPGSANSCFGLCFPPPQMVAVVLQKI